MDDRRFDNLARLIGTGASRRSVLKSLLGLGGAAVAGTVASDSVDARGRGTRPTIPPPPPPDPTTTTTPAPTTTTADPCTGYHCGLDCCDGPDQCCDGECCPDGTVCLTQVFDEGPFVEEETCCPIEQACNDQCCDGTCIREGLFINGIHFPVPQTELTCCPASSTVCAVELGGGLTSELCCDGDTPQCCLRSPNAEFPEFVIPACIAADACCADDDCSALDDPDNCLEGFCTDQFACEARSSCAEGSTCCQREGFESVCITDQQCCLNRDCFEEFDQGCVACIPAGRPNAHTCDPRREGMSCGEGECDVCDANGQCIETSCPTTTTTSDPGTSTTPDPGTTTPEPPATTTAAPSVTTTPEPGCTEDADCENGCYECVDNACVYDCGDGLCCDQATDPDDWFCQPGECCPDSDDCGPGMSCCEDDDEPTVCIGEGDCCTRNDCSTCELCIDGACQFGCGDNSHCCELGDRENWFCVSGVCCPDADFCSGESVCCADFLNVYVCVTPGTTCCNDNQCGACQACDDMACVFSCQAGDSCCPENESCDPSLNGGLGGCVSCTATGGACTDPSGDECCSGLCPRGECVDCLNPGDGGCSDDGDCCNLSEVDQSICSSGACCTQLGDEGCFNDAHCCGSAVCTRGFPIGTCQAACTPQGQSCLEPFIQCCYGYGCFAESNFVCVPI